MRFSCPEQMLTSYPLAERMRVIKDSGFDGVDCRFTTLEETEFPRCLSKVGLPLASVYSQIRTPSLLDATAADRAQAVEDIVNRARMAYEFGAENLILVPVFGPPRIPGHHSPDQIAALETALLIVSLKEVSQRLADTAITVVIEPLNQGETHFLCNPRTSAGICDQVDAPNIATMVDTYHCHQEALDIPEQIRAVGEHLRLVHYSDSERGLPGEGQVDFDAATAALEMDEFDGWIGFECRQIASEQDEQALAASVSKMRSLVRVN